jgi:epoxide hydrolase 4
MADDGRTNAAAEGDALDSNSDLVMAGMLRAGFSEGDWRHDFLESEGGLRFHYVAVGDVSKPLLLFIHGYPETWYSWRHQMKEFSADFYCVAFDMRGYNDSDKPDHSVEENYVIETFVEDVKAVVDGLGCTRVTVWSHDWGSIVAWRFVLKYHSMVEKFVVESAPHPMQVQYHASLKNKLTHLPEILFEYAAKKGVFEKAVLPDTKKFIWDAFRGKKFAPINQEHITDDDVKVFEASFKKPDAAICATTYYRHVGRVSETKRDGYGDLEDVPVLVLTGAKDQNVKPASMRGIEKVRHSSDSCFLSRSFRAC